jgi:lipopolysaccharide transport system permease protein
MIWNKFTTHHNPLQDSSIKLLTSPFRAVYRHRSILRQTVQNDLRARHAGALLGFVWLVLQPILFLGTYAFVYLYIFHIRIPGTSSGEYVARIFCGLIPFLGFAEAINTGVNSLTNNANLIRKTLFPAEMIPVKAVLTAQVTQGVGTLILVLVLALMGHLSWWILLLPLLWWAHFMMTMGIVWILATANVFIRDLQSVTAILTLVLMMVSPIAYTASMAPASLQIILKLNPLYYIIVSYQEILLAGRFPPHETFWILLALSLLLFCFGYWFMNRLKNLFAEYV